MKRFVFLFTIVALVIPLGRYAAAQQPQAGQEAAPSPATKMAAAPTFKVGDTWKYRRSHIDSHKGSEFSRTVTAVKGDLVTVVTGSDQELVFTKEGNEVKGHDRGGLSQRFDPFLPELEFPLVEGKTWTRSFTVHSERRKRPHNGTAWAKVGGWERISVPAGDFTSIRIEIQFQGYGQGMAEVCWYAQEVKRFIKCSFSEAHKEGDYELVTYRVQ